MMWTRLGRRSGLIFFYDEDDKIIVHIEDRWTAGKGSIKVWHVLGGDRLGHIHKQFVTREEALAYVQGLEDGEKSTLLNQLGTLRIADLIQGMKQK